MRRVESIKFSNISATPAPFCLDGGLYSVAVVATFGGGSVTLEALGPDGTTYINVNAFLAQDIENYWLPPGTYKLAIATATAVYATITRIPGD